jgi:elongator complex protein 3
MKELEGASLIRELHVFGRETSIGKRKNEASQHIGFGGQLMQKAEEISKQAGFKKIAVISGIGVREYYRKKGYKLEGTYMLKNL